MPDHSHTPALNFLYETRRGYTLQYIVWFQDAIEIVRSEEAVTRGCAAGSNRGSCGVLLRIRRVHGAVPGLQITGNLQFGMWGMACCRVVRHAMTELKAPYVLHICYRRIVIALYRRNPFRHHHYGA